MLTSAQKFTEYEICRHGANKGAAAPLATKSECRLFNYHLQLYGNVFSQNKPKNANIELVLNKLQT